VRLQDRVVVVTGVSRRAGIGAGVARRLGAEGAQVFLQSWSPHDAEQPWGADAGGPEALLLEFRDTTPSSRGALTPVDPRRCSWSFATVAYEPITCRWTSQNPMRRRRSSRQQGQPSGTSTRSSRTTPAAARSRWKR
jgi:hypothetical protein